MIEVTFQNEQEDIYRLINQADHAIEILQSLSDKPTTTALDVERLKHLMDLLTCLRTDLEGVL
jgi:hypothetical protein